jgi:hypothetical protein
MMECYRLEPRILGSADTAGWRRESVLAIGVGPGADHHLVAEADTNLTNCLRHPAIKGYTPTDGAAPFEAAEGLTEQVVLTHGYRLERSARQLPKDRTIPRYAWPPRWPSHRIASGDGRFSLLEGRTAGVA